DRRIEDGTTVELGGTTLTALVTPGHTKGCTPWTTTTEEEGRTYSVLFHCSTSVVDALVGNTRYPDIVRDYEQTFARLKALEADVFLINHPWFFRMAETREAQKAGAAHPIVDSGERHQFNYPSAHQLPSAVEAARHEQCPRT